jgi:hypothetical protein
MNPREIAGQWIALMGHVEETCEKHGLVPPVEVRVTEADGNRCDFDFNPEAELVDLPFAPIAPPVVLTFTDALGVQVEIRLLDFAPSLESKKRFMQ